LRRWDQRTNVSRSASDSDSSAFGRPRPAIQRVSTGTITVRSLHPHN
jgi:hypothetical protein